MVLKHKTWILITIAVVCVATVFLWFGKTPFTALTTQPVDPDPVESSDDINAQNETDPSDDQSSTECFNDHEEDESDRPVNFTEIFPKFDGPLELPVEGATGWAGVEIPLYSEASTESRVIVELDAGEVFLIKEEVGDWWQIESGYGEIGWVEHVACFINLPDVLPSIVYNITNASAALTRSSGYEIPGVTGNRLYEAWSYNPRLERYEFIVPALYSTSKMLCTAQQLALKAGDTIILHEAYRDHASLQRSVRLLRELMESNEEVRSAIEDGPWSLTWFIATSLSNHQRGAAFDATLGKVLTHEIVQVGEVLFPRITEVEEYQMPTTIHELSPMAIALVEPVSSRSRDAWREVPLADTMTPGAILLQNYFDEAGFTPLASEWWHFNDLDGATIAAELEMTGQFILGGILSVMPTY